MYQSDFTQFINGYLNSHPQVEAQRHELRLTLWDRQLDLDEQRRWRQSHVPQKPYVYQPD